MAGEEHGQDTNTPYRLSFSAEFTEIKGMGKGRGNSRDREKKKRERDAERERGKREESVRNRNLPPQRKKR